MPEYEYKRFTIAFNRFDEPKFDYLHFLNTLGKDGWIVIEKGRTDFVTTSEQEFFAFVYREKTKVAPTDNVEPGLKPITSRSISTSGRL